MAPIVAPQPRRLKPSPPIASPSDAFPSIAPLADDPFISKTPNENYPESFQLKSPFRIQSRVKRSIINKSPTPCSTTNIASSLLPFQTPRPSRRQHRHCCRRDCPITSRPPVPFDDLPWSSALLQPPVGFDAFDIADLSQLAVEPSGAIASDGPGPIRHRRSSLRSAPLGRPHSRSRSPQRLESLPSWIGARDATLSQPHTPPPRFPPPAEVKFWNLMPVMTPAPAPST
ncbi:hypothetical protein EVG20_g621 [Dentipellis fragilis]|uniref:Uncharacterized protein n=1 Tax=Dentipellis fragilis TaxID=205917 RepID=A0A4Y9ZET4_9AGAM|nr:hypothetical protein EVG20_g621 [Dentipellis fragilis]